MSNHDNSPMTSMIHLRNHSLVFVFLVTLASSLLLPMTATAQTGTYTRSLSGTSQSLLNANYNPVQYNAVVLRATNPAQYGSDLWVNSPVNISPPGGPNSIFTSMTWTNSSLNRVTSSIAGIDGNLNGSSSVSLGIGIEKSKGSGWKALNYTRERSA